MENNYKYDVLRMYFGEDYKPCDGIIIHQPTIQQILDYGESKFWALVSLLCSNPTSLRVELWDLGIDWNDVKDIDLFSMIIHNLKKEDTEIIFGDLDLSLFNTFENDDGATVLVYIPNGEVQIDEEIYERIVGYLRLLFNINPKVEKAKGKTTKEMIIWEDKDKIKKEIKKQEKSKWNNSTLFTLISAAVNHPGFKYKKNELRDVGIFEFMDSVQRLQIYESVTSLMTGMYMGMIDTKKMDLSKELNWARNIYEE